VYAPSSGCRYGDIPSAALQLKVYGGLSSGQLWARVHSYLHYRRATTNLQLLFPNATPEQLAQFDDECAICKERMAAAKKLPCGHLFHFSCLRSWLEQGASVRALTLTLTLTTSAPSARNCRAGTSSTSAACARGSSRAHRCVYRLCALCRWWAVGCVVQRCQLRIVTLRVGAGRQKVVLERWTNPKLSRRTCTCKYGLQWCRGRSAGVAKRPREPTPHPKPPTVTLRSLTVASRGHVGSHGPWAAVGGGQDNHTCPTCRYSLLVPATQSGEAPLEGWPATTTSTATASATATTTATATGTSTASASATTTGTGTSTASASATSPHPHTAHAAAPASPVSSSSSARVRADHSNQSSQVHATAARTPCLQRFQRRAAHEALWRVVG
jgi:hypothetical protein